MKFLDKILGRDKAYRAGFKRAQDNMLLAAWWFSEDDITFTLLDSLSTGEPPKEVYDEWRIAKKKKKPMKYAVVKMGVYMHGTWGPFDTIEEACNMARGLAANDSDDYHEWEVRSIDPIAGLGGSLGHVRGPRRFKEQPLMDDHDTLPDGPRTIPLESVISVTDARRLAVNADAEFSKAIQDLPDCNEEQEQK